MRATAAVKRASDARKQGSKRENLTGFARANGGTHGMVLVNVKAVVVY
jgi:hypothetical protein